MVCLGTAVIPGTIAWIVVAAYAPSLVMYSDELVASSSPSRSSEIFSLGPSSIAFCKSATNALRGISQDFQQLYLGTKNCATQKGLEEAAVGTAVPGARCRMKKYVRTRTMFGHKQNVDTKIFRQ